MLRALVTSAAIAASILAYGAGSASAGTPCWRAVINDWYDNTTIDSRYPVHCYREALQHAPSDLRIYSDLPDKLERALQAALLRQGDVKGTSTMKVQTEAQPDSKAPSRTPQSTRRKHGPIEKVLDQLGPSRADSLPIPLFILAGVAGLLIAAGAVSLTLRRLAARRVRPRR